MRKRGQTTPLVILGVVIVIIVVLLLYLRGSISLGPITPAAAGDKMLAVSDHVKTCIGDVGDEPIRRIGLQGGHLSLAEDTFRYQDSIGVSYLCYNRKDDPRCYTRLLTRDDMEEELSKVLKQELNKCLDLNKFKRGVTMTLGAMGVSTDIGNENVQVVVTLPVAMKKGDVVVKEDTFSKTFNYPLGRLYKVSQDIVEIETEVGEFEQLSYMLAHKGQYVIDKKKPYPDKHYILRSKDSDYIFQFMIQGEQTA